MARVFFVHAGLLTLGPLSIVWALLDERFAEMQGVILGIYAIALALLMWGYEYFKGYDRPGTNTISFKGIAYIVYVFLFVVCGLLCTWNCGLLGLIGFGHSRCLLGITQVVYARGAACRIVLLIY